MIFLIHYLQVVGADISGVHYTEPRHEDDRKQSSNGHRDGLRHPVNGHHEDGVRTSGRLYKTNNTLYRIHKLILYTSMTRSLRSRDGRAMWTHLMPMNYHIMPMNYHLMPMNYHIMPMNYHIMPTNYHIMPNTGIKYYLKKYSLNPYSNPKEGCQTVA